MHRVKKESTKLRYRYGVGEWYGKSFIHVPPADRKKFALIQALAKKDRPKLACPFRTTPDKPVLCTKEGGVCSLRLYQLDPTTTFVSPAPGEPGGLVTTCPYRFEQDRSIFRWIAETLLGHKDPIVVNQVGFLERAPESMGEDEGEQTTEVGRIDNVLVHPTREPMHWCALEIQAVYFSGAAMSKDFRMLRSLRGRHLPFPSAHRRPDFRSSGPKRLMPQLQIKVPTLRRWGKKMAVVVDRSFFGALGPMDEVEDVSNCDIAWFVVKYDESKVDAVLRPDFVRFTTLERAVEGLTGGYAVGLSTFEARIREKLAERQEES